MNRRTIASAAILLTATTLMACDQASDTNRCEAPDASMDLIDTGTDTSTNDTSNDADLDVLADPLGKGYCPDDDPRLAEVAYGAGVPGLIAIDDERKFPSIPGDMVQAPGVIGQVGARGFSVSLSREEGGVVSVEWPPVPAGVELSLPERGAEVMVTVVCGPDAIWCGTGDLHVVIEDLGGGLLFEGGSLSAFTAELSTEHPNMRMSLYYRPSAPSCRYNILTVIPIQMQLSRPVAWVGSGEQRIVEGDGERLFVWVLRAFNTESPSPPDDQIEDVGWAFMVPVVGGNL